MFRGIASRSTIDPEDGPDVSSTRLSWRRAREQTRETINVDYIAGDGLIGLLVPLDKVLKCNAINVLHCHIVLSADFTEMIGLYNVGMDQVGDQLGFADEVTTKLIYFGVFFTD